MIPVMPPAVRALIEEIAQRHDVTLLEVFRGGKVPAPTRARHQVYRALLARDWTRGQIARLFGVSTSGVARALRKSTRPPHQVHEKRPRARTAA